MKKMEYTEPITNLHLVELETPFCQPQSNLNKAKLQVQVDDWQEGFDTDDYDPSTGGAAIIDFDE